MSEYRSPHSTGRLLSGGLLGALLLLGAFWSGRSSVAAAAPEVARATSTPLAALARPLAAPRALPTADPEAAPSRLLTTRPLPPRPRPRPVAVAPPPLPPPHPVAVAPPPLPQFKRIEPPPAAPRPPEPPPAVEQPSVEPRLPGAAYPQAPSAAPPALAAAASPFEPSDVPAIPSARFLARAESASSQLDRALTRHELAASFEGTGSAGEMVWLRLENRGRRARQVDLYPGMILDPGGAHVQPLLLNEERHFTLRPGETVDEGLQAFCMNSGVPAPSAGVTTPYRFATRTLGGRSGPEAVALLPAYRRLVDRGAFESLLPGPLHQQAIVQIGVWKSLHQTVGDRQWASVLGFLAADPDVKSSVSRDVARLLNEARH